jgi:hypothetical protein
MAAPAPNHLRPVVTEDLPVYPLAVSERLDGQSFVKWNSQRWLASRMFLEASYEVQGVARALFDLCQTQTPVGTLPDSDLQLSRMLHLDQAVWVDLKNRPLGPLHNWHFCLCGSERRLMHPVVLEVVQDALMRRQMHELSKEERAAAARYDRMVKALLNLGMEASATEDMALMGRMDEWLKANCRGRRTETVYRQAVRHAVQVRWCDPQPKLL